MTEIGEAVLAWALMGSAGLLMAALVLTFVRIIIGPSLPDRVVALDLLSLLTVCFIVLFSIIAGTTAYLDIAIALALVAFLGTVAFARFVERRRRLDDEQAAGDGS